jgi:hypothetical protein
MTKEIKEYEFKELADYMTGLTLEGLGRGHAMRTLVMDAMVATLEWKNERSTDPERIKALESALERTRDNFVLSVLGKPVRDMAETLAECQKILGCKSPYETFRP